MKHAEWFFVVLMLSAAAVSFAGDIQVLCAPDLRVYLDDEFLGVSSAKEDGLYLANVAKGTHTIRIEKEGFVPLSYQVEIGLPIEVKVGEFSPQPAAPTKVPETTEEAASPERSVVSAEPETPKPVPAVAAVPEPRADEGANLLVGRLLVTSAPQNCLVEIDGRSENKNSTHLSIDGLSVGEHTISFSKQGYESISGVITIEPGAEVAVRGNLQAGKVEVVREGMGSLRLTSTPTQCTVLFRGKRYDKNYSKFRLSYIPVGEYPLVVSMGGRSLSTMVTIADEQRTIADVNFMKKEESWEISQKPE